MKGQNSFQREAITEALWLCLTLVAGVGLATGVTALFFYALGKPESSALTAGFIAMVVLFVLSEAGYRVGWLPEKFVWLRRRPHPRQRHILQFSFDTYSSMRDSKSQRWEEIEIREALRIYQSWKESQLSLGKAKKIAPARPLGLPDDAFEQRRPLLGQITKREVRAVSLYSLGLRQDSVVWDIGAGTGSVSVEAALIAHRGTVYAIERDTNSLDLLRHNVDRWAPGQVYIIPGEAPEALADLPGPDSVFVGGSGGRLADILDCVARRLKPQGRVVVNLAALERVQEVYHRFHNLGFATEMVMVHAARGKEMGDGTMRLESLNPVFVVTAWRATEE